MGRVKCLYDNFSEPELGEGKNLYGCLRCNQTREYFFNGVCDNCFCEIQKEKGCICPFIKLKQGSPYRCSLCEEFHGPDNSIICKKCAEKQDAQNVNDQKKEAFYKNVLVGLIVILLLGCLLFFVVWKNKQTNKELHKTEK